MARTGKLHEIDDRNTLGPTVIQMTIDPMQPRDPVQSRWICAFLASITLIAFWEVQRHAFINYDDQVYVTKNHAVLAGLGRESVRWAFSLESVSGRAGATVPTWHPLTWLSHMLDVELYGLDAAGHHRTNLLFHVANVLLLFGLLRRSTAAPYRSAAVAALFAIHPLHVESVAWVAERKDLLATLFWLLTTWAYVRYVERPGVLRYLTTAVSFCLGLMAKPMLVTLPFALLLLDYWPLRRVRLAAGSESSTRAGIWRIAAEKIPLLALAALASLLTYQTQRGAMRALQHLSLGTRIANAVDAYASYIGKMIWPADLVVFYPHPGDALESSGIVGAALLLLGLTLVALRFARSRPYLAVGWFWYLGTLVPVIGIVQVGKQAMADRYTYIPLIGLFIAVVWWVADLTHAWRRRRWLLAAAAAAVGLALILATRQQVAHWRDDFSLYEHALRVNPDNAVVHHNLGLALTEAKQLEGAVEHFQRAIEIDPNFADAYIDLGIDLDDLGRREEATQNLVRACEIEPGNPAAHYNLGVVYLEQGEIELARTAFERTVELQPRHALANLHLGPLLASLKRFDEAAAHLRIAIAANPQSASAHQQLGLVHAMTGRFDEAIAEFETALRIDPRAPQAREMLELARRAKASRGNP